MTRQRPAWSSKLSSKNSANSRSMTHAEFFVRCPTADPIRAAISFPAMQRTGFSPSNARTWERHRAPAPPTAGVPHRCMASTRSWGSAGIYRYPARIALPITTQRWGRSGLSAAAPRKSFQPHRGQRWAPWTEHISPAFMPGCQQFSVAQVANKKTNNATDRNNNPDNETMMLPDGGDRRPPGGAMLQLPDRLRGGCDGRRSSSSATGGPFVRIGMRWHPAHLPHPPHPERFAPSRFQG